MSTPGKRVRLRVQVRALRPEDSHGPRRAAIAAAFKPRNFGISVNSEDTFDQVWQDVEKRYKESYLNVDEARDFSIKNLQDSFGDDVVLSDTVSDVFEEISNPEKRVLFIIPFFADRAVSLPSSTALRPENVRKRMRELEVLNAPFKKRCMEAQLEDDEVLNHARNRPLPSTESDESGANPSTARRDAEEQRRSRSNDSVQYVQVAQTGRTEFRHMVKVESPELGSHSMHTIPESDEEPYTSPKRVDNGHPFKIPMLPASQMALKDRRQSQESRQESLARSPESPEQPPERGMPEHNQNQENVEEVEEADVDMQDQQAGDELEPNDESPDFVVRNSTKKPAKTYARAPRTPNLFQKELHPFSKSRSPSTGTHRSGSVSSKTSRSLSARAHSFRRPTTDEIVSTPQQAEAVTNHPKSSIVKSSELLTARRASHKTRKASSVADGSPTLGASGDVHERPKTLGGDDSTSKSQSSSLRKPSRTSFKMPKPGTTPKKRTGERLVDSTSSAKLPTEGTPAPKQRGRPKKTASSQPALVEMRLPSVGASNIQTSKDLIPAAKLTQVELLKRKLEEKKAKQEAQRKAQRKNSPKVVIASNKSTPALAENTPTNEPPNRSVPLLNGERSVSQGSSVDQGSETHQISTKSAPKAQRSSLFHGVPREILPRGMSETSGPKEPSARSEVPPPQNVRHISVNGVRVSDDLDPLAKENGTSPKTTATIPPAVPTVETSINNLPHELLDQPGSRATPRRSEVPVPNNAKHLNLNGNGAREISRGLSSSTTSKVRRSEVPLPENVRHLVGITMTKPRSEEPEAQRAKGRGRLAKNNGKVSSGSPAPESSAINGTRSGRKKAGPGSTTELKARRQSFLHVSSEELPNKTAQVSSLRNSKPAATMNDAVSISSGKSDTSSDESTDDDASNTVVMNGTTEPGNIDRALPPEVPEVKELSRISPNGTASVNREAPPEEKEPETDEEEEALTDEEAKLQQAAQADEEDEDDADALPNGEADADQNADVNGEQPDMEAAAQIAAPWTSNSWGFGTISQDDGADEAVEETAALESHSKSRTPSASASELHPDANSFLNSGSASGEASTRSSPAQERRPARYLTHSPTPESAESSSAEEAAPSPPPAQVDTEDSDSESSISSGDSSSESDSDVEMADANAEPDATAAPPSSPPVPQPIPRKTHVPSPRLGSYAKSQRNQIPSSQSLPHMSQIQPPRSEIQVPRSQVPLPPSSALPSTARVVRGSSQPAAAAVSRSSVPRTTPGRFKTLREQISEVKSTPKEVTRSKVFDPRTQSLAKLAKKSGNGKGKVFAVSESSSEDESDSSSGSVEVEVPKAKPKGKKVTGR
ncbi:hypothetical protein BCR34DRAFT_589417 [Clohesyomyces aquaticus]|uniref:Nucleolar protein Dnt1-like N-terminal domain-containing protein n=1 Tax=Clohesyomyces aquaticus TaxID=1231657 RepID=A0A1Y1ZGC0_9PLEO|nr:hypothetical protein BCR34DRAFT_589417 [Clohesyomyces aquaticus]